MNMITNPILRGFHPDPSICRAGEDYYIATSTFEWFPGVRIQHSRDLVHWRPIASPLTRVTQLNMEGNINSGGVWAPCLSYDNGLFYLIYTDVKSRVGAFKDTHNYLVTATDIEGPWSEPVYLNSSGFDPSLFHDEDGRKWLVNMIWDHRKGKNRFAGIVLQEYSVREQQMVGPAVNIFKGTELGLTEAPHLYKHKDYYYLITAEGGTGYEHAVTVSRSRTLQGPYEVDPDSPILTSYGRPELDLQKAGHGSLVETHTGEWYMAHLVGRPINQKYCILGRETALQQCTWSEDGWLRLASGDRYPEVQVPAPKITAHPFEPAAEMDHFDQFELQNDWNTLRIPPDPTWLSLTERPGYLRLHGMESMSSTHRQSMVARRLQAFECEAETCLEFAPDHPQQMAGLILYYDTKDYLYLRVTCHEEKGLCLGIIQSRYGIYDELLLEDIPLESVNKIRLKVVVNHDRACFYYALDDDPSWCRVSGWLDITHLSDESPEYIRFTGTYIGLCVQDLGGTRKHADFDYFVYKEMNNQTVRVIDRTPSV
ncbi:MULTISPECIES: glycoside hydrolase family 43 protein [unclassified Paenibacillus]|uniref:glycoside hydrolase family 43 protein n=1 Tax=unclassified Paenibacillus TaxID=185978 RepID=UPI0008CCA871|nr:MULTISPECIES: glycoside hydrolase family 43 protein [unclassified Paenibacillus]QLG42461.1 glycoside hydrolase family 43 protein [Paenibacillus sp. E222]SEM78672.1 xylan 1,4-beta-xylosidase [Paenibacillus sp. OK076]